MTDIATINAQIQNGKRITFCPWEPWTNQATATVVSVVEDRVVRYRVEKSQSLITRRVSERAWQHILDQTR